MRLMREPASLKRKNIWPNNVTKEESSRGKKHRTPVSGLIRVLIKLVIGMQKYDCITEHTLFWEYIQTRKHIRLKIAYPFPSLSASFHHILYLRTWKQFLKGQDKIN